MSVRLFVDLPLAHDAEFHLPATAARHVQVRRLQPGDRLVLFNGQGGEWLAAVVQMGRSEVRVRVEQAVAVQREAPRPVTVAIGMPANERMDLLVEKATELGVFAIQPLLCERSVLRLAADRALRKREHWQAVAAAASEQSGRTRVPAVAPVLSLERWLGSLGPGSGQRLLLSPREGTPLLPQVLLAAQSWTTLSGPEGGLSAAEESLALQHGFVAAALGPRVLRAETAPLAVLAWMALQS